ncbi:MAG: lipoyl(octanoyl) transferase LipB [Actinobacteria bacterium]|nr:lipoyl(octanoyl) transferase LipB [Actinomycetota bacterium]
MTAPLNVRWLGRVPYREAFALQDALFTHTDRQYLLLLEHPHVFTHGPSAELDKNLKCIPEAVGAELVKVNRGGDVTYHGPGQLVGYPILTLAPKHGGKAGPADTTAYVHGIEQVIIDSLTELGVAGASRFDGYPGVWLGVNEGRPRKICAIGVRLTRGRTMHGFALNVETDLTYMREHIVPCGIAEHPVTSLREEGIAASMREVADVVARHVAARFSNGEVDRRDVAWVHRPEDLSPFSRGAGAGEKVRLTGRLAQAGVTGGIAIEERKPDWLRPKVHHGPEVLETKKVVRDLGLVTVCEEAGCPNLSECWADRTATFMVLGERCTRACGFCLVDTRKPLDPETDEPARVAEAVARMGLMHAVLTMVARDDLADGGMAHVADCVRAIRRRSPLTRVETLISDVKGTDALDLLIAAKPDVLNHNIETVARLQRAVRPSAGYARSATLVDLASIGVDIVTIGQYLRPTTNHLPVARWVEPAEFEHLKSFGEGLGIGHVESSPLTRSSYHARESAESAGVAVPVVIS